MMAVFPRLTPWATFCRPWWGSSSSRSDTTRRRGVPMPDTRSDMPDKPDKYEPEQTCYRMAYFVLPQYVAGSRDKLVQELSGGRRGAAFFYVLTCTAGGKEPDADVAHAFDVHAGGLDDRHDYY